MKTLNKIIYIISCLIIVAGIIVWKNKGFNLDFQYSARKQINISNNTGINKDDINQIASEVLGNTKYSINEVEIFKNSVTITAEDITEDQRNEIVNKFNEKYGTDIKSEDIDITSIPFTRVQDAMKPFILPGIITIAIIIVYFLIRFSKLGFIKILLKTVIIPILSELVLFSIIAITRIPLGQIAVACGVGLYVIVIAILTSVFENQREKKIAEEQEDENRKEG